MTMARSDRWRDIVRPQFVLSNDLFSPVRRLAGTALASGVLLSCAGDFDTTRKTPPRGTLGTELFTLICDRVGAQSLPEDINGQSFHGVCHADSKGRFNDRVDVAMLPVLAQESVDRRGGKVSHATLEARRKYHVDRIERLGAHHNELVIALDDLVADGTIPRKDTGNRDPARTCDPAGDTTLHKELPLFLERITSLYNDGTLPEVTRAVGRTLGDVESADDAREALARLEARKGYRPSTLSQGIAKPALSYPGLIDLANTLFKSIATDSDPLSPSPTLDNAGKRIPIAGPGQPAFQIMLAALHEAQRDPENQAATLQTQVDEKTGWTVLSRPRSGLELAQTVLLSTDESFARTELPEASRYVAKRDVRGVAQVEPRDGKLPSPFLDTNKDGLADINELGEFVVPTTSDEGTPPSPFHIPKFGSGTEITKRDAAGRALASDGKPVFASVDLTRTLLSAVRADVRTTIDPDAKFDALGKVAAGLTVAVGVRGPVVTKEYAPDPSLVDDWKLRFNEPVPNDLGKAPNGISYRPILANSSPVYALAHALGQVLSKPNTFDALQVLRRLVQDNPKVLARIISFAFEAKRIADAHPEAKTPENSTFWDEVFDTLIRIARAPKNKFTGRGLIEDTISALGNDKTVALQSTFAAYVEYRDQLTYNRNPPSPGAPPDVNGPLWNVTTSSVAPLKTPVDRSQPDVGDNRSVMQRFLQLLHDASGLAVCTKEGAVAHVKIKWNGFPVNLDYPTDQLISVPACLLVGALAPSSKGMRKCGMLRLENVALLVIDVVLGRAKFDIRDDCLRNLMNSPLTTLIGGADQFLEDASGIKGMSTVPTVAGISRMLYFQTKAAGFNDVPFDPGDPTPEFQTKPKAFLEGVIEVVPSMVCKPAPYVDPSDGKTIQLRACDNYSETLRVRDANALFPVEQNDFVTNVKPLAAAFGNYEEGAQLFIDLFDNLHRHWGTTAQPKDVCDPTLPKTDARWCSGDGLVSYEAILAEILRNTDLLASVQELVKTLDAIKIEHCDAFDAKTGVCQKSTVRDGVVVLGDLLRDLVDPDLNKGLKDHLGQSFSNRNDGTKNAQTTPLYLLVDAINAIDKQFRNHPEGTARLAQWRSARSVLVDAFFGVKGTGTTAEFVNAGIPKMVNILVNALASQVAAHCPDRTKLDCKWASDELSQSAKETLESPFFPSVVDLLDELQKDPEVRTQLGNFLVYLLSDTEHDAMASTLAGITDMLQSLSDDSTRIPITRATRALVGTRVLDSRGRTIRTSVADAAIGLLSRVLARGRNANGDRVCHKELDPNEAMVVLLRRAVATKTALEPSPLDTLSNVATEVNRSDPSSTAKLASPDYKNVSKEVGEFCLDKGRGLEQVYEVIRQATR